METVSVIVGCSNRADVLLKSIPSWLSKKEIGEIIIVDWNSSRMVSEDLSDVKDNRIKIIRVENCGGWVLSLALNLASTYAKFPLLLKLDTDNILENDFFSVHQLKSSDRVFYTGNWENARNDNEKHLNGVIFIPTREFRSVNGYNEYIRSYGYDDTDLYNRLVKNGMEKKDLSNLTIFHIPHEDSRRSGNKDLEFLISQNMFLCRKLCWPEKGQTEYVKTENAHPGNIVTITPVNMGQFVPSPVILEECEVLALRNILNKHGFPWESTERKSLSFLRELHSRRNLPKFIIEPKNGLGNKLRALASAATIAEAKNLNLLVLWIPDDHYQSRFSDHFDDSQLCVISSNSIKSPSVTVVKRGDCNSFSESSNLLDFLNDIYVASATVINHISTSWIKECEWIRNNIKPLSWVQRRIERFKKLFQIENTIGIHVRMGQDSSKFSFEDWSGYTENQKRSASKNREESHYSHFMNEMEKIWAFNPQQKFFLCADSEDVYKAFQERFPALYGTYIIHVKKDVWDRSPNQLTTAVIDVFLLSMCSELYGSSWSSFTELAQRIGQPKVKIVGRDFGSKKFALLSYPGSRNIGDDIQSIAAKQFLPTIDYLVDRDDQSTLYNFLDKESTDETNLKDSSVKIIQNGWYDGRQTKFPPHRSLKPLFISFHLNETPDLYKQKEYSRLAETARHEDKLLTPDVVKYFQNYMPVGTRDFHTLKMFEENGIKAFHSCCLTLTLEGPRIGLNPPPKVKTSILVVDAHHREVDLYTRTIPITIRAKSEKLTHGLVDYEIPHFFEKQKLALSLLQKYQDASMVITDRLHVALPCLALGTPVFFIYDKMDTDPRYDDTIKTLLGDGKSGPKNWNWSNPQIQSYQKELIDKIKKNLTEKIKHYLTV